MVIHNQIFDSFRQDKEKIEKAIKLLEENGYLVYNKDKVYDSN